MVNCRSPRSPLVERKCEACGNMFMAKPSNVKAGSAKACSKDCSYKVRKTRSDKKPRKPHVCQWCGCVFVSKAHDISAAKYASLRSSPESGSKEHAARNVGAN